jgi:hypothetical protein
MPTMMKKHRIRLVDPQGGRSPTAGSTSRQDRGRWSSRRRSEVVRRILRGETLDALNRELGVSPGRLAEWREEAIAAMQAGLQAREPEGNGCVERFIRTLKEQLLWLLRLGSVAEPNRALREFMDLFNHTGSSGGSANEPLVLPPS